MPELVEQFLTLTRTWGFTIWVTPCLPGERKQPWRTVERSLFRPAGGGITPREAYNAIVDNNVELVSMKTYQDASRQTQLSRIRQESDAAVW